MFVKGVCKRMALISLISWDSNTWSLGQQSLQLGKDLPMKLVVRLLLVDL